LRDDLDDSRPDHDHAADDHEQRPDTASSDLLHGRTDLDDHDDEGLHDLDHRTDVVHHDDAPDELDLEHLDLLVEHELQQLDDASVHVLDVDERAGHYDHEGLDHLDRRVVLLHDDDACDDVEHVDLVVEHEQLDDQAVDHLDHRRDVLDDDLAPDHVDHLVDGPLDVEHDRADDLVVLDDHVEHVDLVVDQRAGSHVDVDLHVVDRPVADHDHAADGRFDLRRRPAAHERPREDPQPRRQPRRRTFILAGVAVTARHADVSIPRAGLQLPSRLGDRRVPDLAATVPIPAGSARAAIRPTRSRLVYRTPARPRCAQAAPRAQ
jgi:hypothetical protein